MKDILDYEMVEYSKEFATVTAGLDAYEMDMLMILIYLAKQKIPNTQADLDNDLKIALTVPELKKVIRHNGNANNNRIIKALKKLFDVKYYFKKDNYVVFHHIFDELRLDQDKQEVILVIKKRYIPLFFRLSGNFTQHKILDYNSLKSKYAKRIYQLLISYKNLKHWEVDASLFRVILEVPASYKWGDIDRFLKPVIDELETKVGIVNLKMEKLKTGNKITRIRFNWEIEKQSVIENEKEEVVEEIKQEDNTPLTDTEIMLYELICQLFPNEYKTIFKKGTDDYIKSVRWAIKDYNDKKQRGNNNG